jgi:hypothetical protein
VPRKNFCSGARINAGGVTELWRKAVPHFAVDPHEFSTHPERMIAPLALLLIVVAYRVVLGIAGSSDLHGLHNFAPVAAVALCGAVFLSRRLAVVLPLAILFISDVVLNLVHYHKPLFTLEIIPRYLALLLIVMLGCGLRGRVRLPGLLAASFVGSIIFYMITNTGLVVDGTSLRENIQRLDSGAYRRASRLAFHMVVLPAYAAQRYALHVAFCRMHGAGPSAG